MARGAAEARAVDEETLIVVVDNWAGTAEREAAVAVAQAHGWTLITPESNSGFGGGV
ncbi:glycosyl transferase family 2, partial [Methylobacterium radiotolerans]